MSFGPSLRTYQALRLLRSLPAMMRRRQIVSSMRNASTTGPIGSCSTCRSGCSTAKCSGIARRIGKRWVSSPTRTLGSVSDCGRTACRGCSVRPSRGERSSPSAGSRTAGSFSLNATGKKPRRCRCSRAFHLRRSTRCGVCCALRLPKAGVRSHPTSTNGSLASGAACSGWRPRTRGGAARGRQLASCLARRLPSSLLAESWRLGRWAGATPRACSASRTEILRFLPSSTTSWGSRHGLQGRPEVSRRHFRASLELDDRTSRRWSGDWAGERLLRGEFAEASAPPPEPAGN